MNHLLQPSAIPTGNSGITGAELFDPTILDISNGLLARGMAGSATLSQYNSFQPDARLHMLRQQSTSTQQNLGFQDHFRNTYSSLNDAQQFSPQHTNQFQSNPSTFVQSNTQQFSDVHVSNSNWVQWNGVKSASERGISELLRNERLGFNKFVPCYEDMKSRSSYFSDLNNKGFEM